MTYERRPNYLPIILCAALCIACLASFWPAARCDFINYDDPDYVTENTAVLNGPTLQTIVWAFSGPHAGNWHPITWLSHAIDVKFYAVDPTGHHITSLILHTFAAVLLFIVLYEMTGSIWQSFFVATFFAVHPLHAESVAWISERKDVLSGLFFMLTLWAYGKYASNANQGLAIHSSRKSLMRIWYGAVLVFFSFGLMSKAMLVTTPCVLLLLDLWPLSRISISDLRLSSPKLRKLFAEKIPLFALSILVSVATFNAQKNAGAVISLNVQPVEFRIENALISYIRYLGKLFWPTNLAVFYPAPKTWPLAYTLFALLTLVVISIFTVRNLRKPWMAVGWFWFLGTLVPVIGIVQVGQQSMADRYTYIPFIGLFIILAWSLSDLTRRFPIDKKVFGVGGLALVFACVLVTRNQLTFWKSSETLFSHALSVTSANAIAHNNLGAALLKKGDSEHAQPHFAEAIHIDPDYAEALGNLALCLAKSGDTNTASALFEKALAIQPTAALYYNLANLLSKPQQFAEANRLYHAALKMRPDFAPALYNLGILEANEGNSEEAANNYKRALALDPKNVQMRLSLGALLAGQGRFDQAIEQFRMILQQNPQNADAHFNLAAALFSKGSLESAVSEFRLTCEIRPDDLEAQESLGVCLTYLGKFSEAKDFLLRALSGKQSARAHYFLALSLDSTGHPDEAYTHYREAVHLAPNASLYLNDLAWLLATSPNKSVRNGKDAVILAERACLLSSEKEPRYLGTLDAAYAEEGRFQDALKTAAKASQLARAAGQNEVANSADRRIALYHEKKPYRTSLPGKDNN